MLQTGLAEALKIEVSREVRVIMAGGPGPGLLEADEDGVVTREKFTARIAGAVVT